MTDKTYLSEKVLASLTSQQYYKPLTLLDQTALSRREKVTVHIDDVAQAAARAMALQVAQAIMRTVAQKGLCVLCTGAADAELAVLQQLVQLYFNDQVDFEHVVIFNLCEVQSFNDDVATRHGAMMERLTRHFVSQVNLNPDRVFTFDACSTHAQQVQAAQAYEQLIADYGGIDVMLCQLTQQCTLGFNESGSEATTTCRGVLLGATVRGQLATMLHTPGVEPYAITLGISNVLAASHLFVIALGQYVARAVRQCAEGQISAQASGTFVQMHRDALLGTDLAAASLLTRITTPWQVTNCQWTPRLTVRAAMWLSSKTGVPVLELTSRDYTEHGMASVLASYGSVEKLNASVFWALRDTITTQPAGTQPQRVLIFSPHPDDAVVTMGATMSRLLQQGHEVHVALQTSGDVAVSDSNLQRMLLMHQRIAQVMPGTVQQEQAERFTHPSAADVRLIKGSIFESEAMMSLTQRVGISPAHLHFMRLPFYTDDALGMGPVTEPDVQAVRQLIEQVQPGIIFFVLDLGDAYGTHVRASSAVVGALQQLAGSPLMQHCQVWMAAGQWSTWTPDVIGLTVPMTPEQLLAKRRAILSFQSQVHVTPYIEGSPESLPWLRALNYNQQLARTIASLGLPSYEAVESFVRYPADAAI